MNQRKNGLFLHSERQGYKEDRKNAKKKEKIKLQELKRKRRKEGRKRKERNFLNSSKRSEATPHAFKFYHENAAIRSHLQAPVLILIVLLFLLYMQLPCSLDTFRVIHESWNQLLANSY